MTPVIVAAVAVVVVAGAIAWWLAYRELQRCEQALVQRARTEAAQAPARTPHGDPVDGTFVDRLTAAYPALVEAGTAWSPPVPDPVLDQCVAIRDGLRSMMDVPPVCGELVATHAGAIAALRDAVHARELGDIASLRGMKAWPIMSTAALAGLYGRFALDGDGDRREALAVCEDLLALWRDLSLVGDLYLRTSAASLVGRTLPMCAEATATASREELEAHVGELATIAGGLPDPDRAVRAELTWMELALFGHELGAATSELPEAARQRIAEVDRYDIVADRDATPRVLAPFVIAPAWEDYQWLADAIAKASREAPVDAMVTIDALLARDDVADLARAGVASRWDRHLSRDHVARGRLAMLHAMASLRLHGDIVDPPLQVPGVTFETTDESPPRLVAHWAVNADSGEPSGDAIFVHRP